MKVLLLGATGNLGQRLLQALIAHNHEVVAFVRSRSKLNGQVEESLLSKTTVIVGDATQPDVIRDTILRTGCDAVINSAGSATPKFWKPPQMPFIVKPVIQALVQASMTLNRPIRCWFLGGLDALDIPGLPGTQILE